MKDISLFRLLQLYEIRLLHLFSSIWSSQDSFLVSKSSGTITTGYVPVQRCYNYLNLSSKITSSAGTKCSWSWWHLRKQNLSITSANGSFILKHYPNTTEVNGSLFINFNELWIRACSILIIRLLYFFVVNLIQLEPSVIRLKSNIR